MSFFEDAIETLTILVDALRGKQNFQHERTSFRHINSRCHGKKPQTTGLSSHKNRDLHCLRQS